MKDKKSMFLVLACAICLGLLSCRSMMDRGTPCSNSEQSYEYVHESLEGFKEIDSLHNVKKLRDKIIIKHRTEQKSCLRAAEDDKDAYGDAIGFVTSNIKEAEHLQGIVIGSENQPISLLGVLAGFSGGAAIFNKLKRKGDYSPEEVEVVKAQVREEGKNGNS